MVESCSQRGQVGIGILIIFIAIVLIAAIASATLIHEATDLRNKAQDTSKDATHRVSNHLLVSSATGTVTDNGTAIETVELVLRPGPGANNINVSKSIVSWASDETATILTHSTTPTQETFTTYGLNSQNAVIANTSDRIVITLNATRIQNGISPGEEITIKITTQYGAKTTHTITAPETFTGGEVAL